MKRPVFQLVHVSGQPVSTDELLADLRRVADLFAPLRMSRRRYAQHGLFGVTTLHSRFGSWNKALVEAGLSAAHEKNISDERLFENLLALWQHFGRQPRSSELAHDPSTISIGPYNRRFGSWTAALTAFVNYANESGTESANLQPEKEANRRTMGRAPSLRLRWRVLHRDRFTCCACGASPARNVGIELHVDHIVPWSKGGGTVLENLQTLCSVCNLGKSNVHAG
jgi:hypothetical protein